MANAIDQEIKYLCNPEVVLREEDEDGGLLFNPDTNQVKIVNSTGLFIWKQFNSPKVKEAVISALEISFDEVPPDAVRSDVDEFLQEMIGTGFIGMVEENR